MVCSVQALRQEPQVWPGLPGHRRPSRRARVLALHQILALVRRAQRPWAVQQVQARALQPVFQPVPVQAQRFSQRALASAQPQLLQQAQAVRQVWQPPVLV